MKDEMRLHVEVEPLPEARVARVRQQVLAAVDAEARGRRTLPSIRPAARRVNVASLVSFVAAAVIAGLVTKLWIVRPPPDARLVTMESGSEYTVGESSLDVGPRSTLLVRGDDAHGVDVVLDRGEVTCEVAPRRGRPAFVVDAGEVRVRVVGTRFTVVRDGAGARVRVDHGAVEVTARGVVTMLHDGERWPREETAAIAPSAAPASPEPPPTAMVTTAPNDEPAPPPKSAPSASSSSRARPSHHATSPSEPLPVTEFPDEPAPTAAPPSASVTPTPREQFEAAARLEATQPARAMDLYREIARGGGAWAPNALYALARLDADRGDKGEAKRLLRDYLARYPRGQNAQDARDLLDRLP